MTDHARPHHARADLTTEIDAGSAGGQMLMGSAIGVAAAFVLAAFLWMAVH